MTNSIIVEFDNQNSEIPVKSLTIESDMLKDGDVLLSFLDNDNGNEYEQLSLSIKQLEQILNIVKEKIK